MHGIRYEPLETTLQKYRVGKDLKVDEEKVEEALAKLLDLDLDELIEHPQWHELLSLTLYYLQVPVISDNLKIKTMRFHVRLCLGMPGFQAVEATLAMLSYLYHELSVAPVSSTASVLSPSHPDRIEIIRTSVARSTDTLQVD